MIRFLVHTISPNQIWASDILTDAVDFVSTQFGVHGAYSDGEPARFDPGEKFDFIWVASLFSHLPAPLFDAWLSKLSDLLSPDGVVCFSVHDETLLPARRSMPPTGIHFRSRSESTKLGRDAYGATYVTEAFVAGAVGRTFGEAHPYFRLKRGLAYQQDLYIVAKNPARDLGLLHSFRWGPWGRVDQRQISDTGNLYLSGWAATLDTSGIESISVSCDGMQSVVHTGIARPDVEHLYNDPHMRQAGWEVVCPRKPGSETPFIEVSVLACNGERALLYAGPALEAKLAWSWVGFDHVLHELTYWLSRIRRLF